MRLKVRLTEDRILPSRHYQPLTELLMESVLGPAEVGTPVLLGSGWWPPLLQGSLRGSFVVGSQDPGPPLLPPVLAQEDTASPLAVLEELTSGDCRQDLATKLVKLFLGQGLAGPFLDYLTRREVTRTSELPAQAPDISPQDWVCTGSLREKRGASGRGQGLLCVCVRGVPALCTSSPRGMPSWIKALALLLLSCVTLGRSLNHSGPLDCEWSRCCSLPDS